MGVWTLLLLSHSVLSNSCDPMDCSLLGFPVLHHLLELAQTHVRWVIQPSNHLILCHPLLLLPPIPPSIRVFSNESTLRMRWPNYWSFSCSIIPSKEHPELISFRMNWLVLLSVQGTLKSLLHHINSPALSFLHSPTLTSIHDHWNNHSLDETNLCWQSNVSANVWNLVKQYRLTCLQNRYGDPDVEKKHMVTKGKRGGRWVGRLELMYMRYWYGV